MKRLVMLAAAMLTMGAFAEMSLADARGKIGEAVNDSRMMGEIIAELSKSNQVAFLSDVNAAIAAMPGSNDEKAAKFLDANEAALKNAQSGNMRSLLAETFATVPPEALTVLNERLASDLFNRAADPSNPMSDADFTRLAQETMEVVQSRTAQTDDAAVRSTFAILMFVRASNGSPADLASTLASALPDASSRELATKEWIPSALGDGVPKSYDSLLGASDAGETPDFQNVADLSASEGMVALLADLGSDKPAVQQAIFGIGNLGLPEGSFGKGLGDGNTRVPRSIDPSTPYFSGSRRGHRGESRGYAGQLL